MRVNFLCFPAFALALVLGPGLGRCEEKGRWPSDPDQLQVSLQVVHALADGPVVCRVVLRNVGATTLDYASAAFSRDSFCFVEASWNRKQETITALPFIVGNPGPHRHPLAPGVAESHVFYLHKDYLAIPPGKCRVGFGWNVYRETKDRKLDRLFVLSRKQEIEILPASKMNLAPVLRNLQQEFARIAPAMQREDDYCWSSSDESEPLVSTLAGSRHPELVPLMVKAIDCLPAKDFKRELILTVHDSYANPRRGFAVLADYLTSPHPASAVDVFEYWKNHDRAHEESAQRQQELKNKPKPLKPGTQDPDEFMWKLRLSEEEAWKTSRRHLDTRLTPDDFARLRSIPNVWVRALLYSHYPEHCPAPWRAALLSDLKKSLEEPPQVGKLVGQLDDPQFEVRERATQDLSRLGPLWVPLFRELAEKSAPPEAARRLRMVADKLDDPVVFRLCQRTIRHLAEERNPQNQAMLNILLDATHPNKATQAARAAVAEKKRR